MLNLLQLSLNKQKLDEVHSSYVSILNQISEDEMLLLAILTDDPLSFVAKYDYDENRGEFFNYQYLENPHPEKDFQFPQHFELYITNLRRLHLVSFTIEKQVPIVHDNTQTGVTQYLKLELTNLGQHFFRATTASNMKIEFKGKYKSLQTFTSDELGNFTIITGKNGRGKTHLLQAIAKTQPPATNSDDFTATIIPKINRLQVEGLEGFTQNIAQRANIRDRVNNLYSQFVALHNPEGKEIARRIVDERIDITTFFPYEKEVVKRVFDVQDDMQILLKTKIITSNYTIHANDHKSLREVFLRWLQQNRMLFVFLIDVCQGSGKTFDEIVPDDLYKVSVHEKYI